jgi:hypothetical protein
VSCPFTGEVFIFWLLLLLMMMMMVMMTLMGFLAAGNYFRIADFIGFILTFVITDAT